MKPKLESSLTCFSFKRLVPDAFNVGLIGSVCTALPRVDGALDAALHVDVERPVLPADVFHLAHAHAVL